MNKIILAILGAAVIIAGVWLFTKGGVSLDGPVARVNGEEISRTQFDNLKAQTVAQQRIELASLDAANKAAFDNQIVENLISRTLLKQAALNSGVVVTEEERDVELNSIKSQFSDEDAYRQALASQGLTEKTFAEEVKNDLIVQAYIGNLDLAASTVTDIEINEAYAQISAGGEAPPLEDIRGELNSFLLQQKQQEVIMNHIKELREEAEVEILI